MDGWVAVDWIDEEIQRILVHDGLSPLLVLLKAGLDAGQDKCAGTGGHSHTLGSQSLHRSLKTQRGQNRGSLCIFKWSWAHCVATSASTEIICRPG